MLRRSSTKAARDAAVPGALLNLPAPLLENVLSFLPAVCLARVAQSCSTLASCIEGAVITLSERLDICLLPKERRKLEFVQVMDDMCALAQQFCDAAIGIEDKLMALGKLDARVTWLHREFIAAQFFDSLNWTIRCRAVELLPKALKVRQLEAHLVRRIVKRLPEETSGVTRGAVLDMLALVDGDTWRREGLVPHVIARLCDVNKIARHAAFKAMLTLEPEALAPHAARVLSHVTEADRSPVHGRAAHRSLRVFPIILTLMRNLEKVYQSLDYEGRCALDALRADPCMRTPKVAQY